MPTGFSTVWFFREPEHGEEAGTLLMNWAGNVIRVTLPLEVSQHLAKVIMGDPAATGQKSYNISFIPLHMVEMPLLNLATFGHPRGSVKEREQQDKILAPFNIDGARKSPTDPRHLVESEAPPSLSDLFGKRNG